MDLRRLIYSKPGRYIISMLLGLGLATIFRKVCNERNCIIFRGPTLSKVKGQVFKYNNKCYKFNEQIEKCDETKKSVNIA